MFTDPVKNLRALGLRDKDIVADLGAGTGFYAVEAAKLVPEGKVYAIDLHKEYLAAIKDKARSARVKNVDCIWGDAEKLGGTKIADNAADVVIASNVLSQVEDKERFLAEIKRILKPGGKVLLVDWSEGGGFGFAHLVPKRKAREMFEKAGFILDREINAELHHYGMIFKK